MDKQQIVWKIENFAPLELAESWDCPGFLVETQKADVKRVMLCLTVTDDVVNQARSKHCDMIISHHPLFCVPSGYSDIDIYCAHTNLDRAKGGTTDELMRVLGCKPAEIPRDLPFVRYCELANPVSVDDFAKKLCKISDNVRVVNNQNVDNITKIAFCAGSGSEFIQQACENGADAFVTGDLKFHTALDSRIVVFDIGHFESEIPVLRVFKELAEDCAEVIFAVEKSPFIKY